ncbi:MAG: hypothetical protein QW416_06465 [Candidatus Nitrosocaldaceae archaeon]
MILDRRGRIFVASIIAGAIVVFVAMYIGANRQAELLESDINIIFADVKLKNVDNVNNALTLNVIFEVSNDSNVVLTVGEISYELSGDNQFLCKGAASFRDIPLVGRPQIFSQSKSAPIETECVVVKSDTNSLIWDTIINDIDNIRWHVNGNGEIESSYAVIPKQFDQWL